MQDAILDREEVCRRTTLSAGTIDRLEDSGKFPLRRVIVGRRIGWSEKEVQAWIDEKLAAGRKGRK